MQLVILQPVILILIPYGFKFIKVANSTGVGTPPIGINENGQAADSTQDTFTLSASNKWIKFDNQTEDTIKLGHSVPTFEKGVANTQYGLDSNWTVDSNNVTFKVPNFTFDEAGHIISAQACTVTLPNGLQKITIANSGNAVVVVNGVASTGSLTATTLTDGITIDNGNRWITLTTNAANKKLTIYHNAPGKQTHTTKTGDETPSFGGTFSIPEVKYDEAGHISGVSTHTVKVPNVLTGYSKGTVATPIAATDTLNQAFGKVENQITSEITNRTSAINNLKYNKVGGGTNEYISSIGQANGIISATKSTLPDYSTYWTKISTLENTISTLQKTIEDLTSRIEALEKV